MKRKKNWKICGHPGVSNNNIGKQYKNNWLNSIIYNISRINIPKHFE